MKFIPASNTYRDDLYLLVDDDNVPVLKSRFQEGLAQSIGHGVYVEQRAGNCIVGVEHQTKNDFIVASGYGEEGYVFVFRDQIPALKTFCPDVEKLIDEDSIPVFSTEKTDTHKLDLGSKCHSMKQRLQVLVRGQDSAQFVYRSEREFGDAVKRSFDALESGRGPSEFQEDWNHFTPEQKQQTKTFAEEAWSSLNSTIPESYDEFLKKFGKAYDFDEGFIGDVFNMVLMAPLVLGIVAGCGAVVAAAIIADNLIGCVTDMSNCSSHLYEVVLGVGMMLTAAAIGVLALVSPILNASSILSRLVSTFCEGVGLWNKPEPAEQEVQAKFNI
jgi:hypothetical protein